MPRHHKMVRYVGKKGRKEATDVLRRRPESLTVMEARKRIQNRKDNTEDNVRRLLLLSSANIGEETGAKLVKRAQTGRYVVTADEFMDKKDNKESAFDEEDFEKFEQELLTSVLNQWNWLRVSLIIQVAYTFFHKYDITSCSNQGRYFVFVDFRIVAVFYYVFVIHDSLQLGLWFSFWRIR